ncbi:MAG: serine hydrolase [Planctomycetota bacterium]|nr:serine hydrolase [Planctomycetota bacterium]
MQIRSSRRCLFFAVVALVPSLSSSLAGPLQDSAGNSLQGQTTVPQAPRSIADRSIADLLRPFVDRQTMAGAVTLVATKDKVLSLEAVGWADIAAKRPMTTDCLFGIASMCKPMTAAALMILVDEGRVNVDDTVEKYLPEFKGQMVIAEKDADHVLLKKPQHPLRIRHLLTHTGGLLYQSPMESPTLDRLTLRDAVRSHALLPLQFEPGTRSLYSSAGVSTAARIVEVIAGVAFEKFMEERLLQPLSMQDSTFVPTEAQLHRLAKLYRTNADRSALEETHAARFSYPLSDRQRQPMPGSGLFSTASDVAKFCQMILQGGVFEGQRVLSEAAVKTMTSRQTPPEIAANYGFCWDVGADGCLGHGGSFRTWMTIDTKLGLITIFLAQQDNDWPREDGKNMVPLFREAAKKLLAAEQRP